MGALPSNQNSFINKHREPEKTLLYSALASGIESWLAERKDDTSKTALPDFVEKEFRGFLRCGLLQYGFVILECPGLCSSGEHVCTPNPTFDSLLARQKSPHSIEFLGRLMTKKQSLEVAAEISVNKRVH